MSYSEEEIQKYLNILQNYEDGLNIISPIKDDNIPPKTPEKVSCTNCGNTHFFKDGGFRYCKKCFHTVGRVFANEIAFKDRCCFRQKCIYKREYHYQNKIEEISSGNNVPSSSNFPHSPIQNPQHNPVIYVPSQTLSIPSDFPPVIPQKNFKTFEFHNFSRLTTF